MDEEDLPMPTLQPNMLVAEGRYRLIRSLENAGKFSTIWLARATAPPPQAEGAMDEPPRRRSRKKAAAEKTETQDVAVKIYTTDESCSMVPLKEVHNYNELAKLRGTPPFIQSLIEATTDPFPCIVLPLAEMDLFDYLELRPDHKLTGQNAAYLMLQLCAGLDFLHSRDLAHGDLKTENILVYEDRHSSTPVRVTISDFDSLQFCTPQALKTHGMRRALQTPDLSTEEVTRTMGSDGMYEYRIRCDGEDVEVFNEEPAVTAEYRAPEFLLDSAVYTPHSDMWALGCIYFEMRTGVPLFEDVRGEEDTTCTDEEEEGSGDDAMSDGSQGGEEREEGEVDEDDDGDEDGDDDDDDDDAMGSFEHLVQIIDLCGPVPPHMQGRHHAMFEHGVLAGVPPQSRPLFKILHQEHGIARKNASKTNEFLSQMLRMDPTTRASARKIDACIRDEYKRMRKIDVGGAAGSSAPPEK